MTVLGVLILLLVAVVSIVVLTADGPATIGLAWFDIDTDVTGVFLAGAASVLLGLLGLWLLKAGLRRSSQRRVEIRGLRKEAAAGQKQHQLEESTSSQSPRPTPVPPPKSAKVASSAPPQPAPPISPKVAPPSPSSSSQEAPDGPDGYFDTAPREK